MRAGQAQTQIGLTPLCYLLNRIPFAAQELNSTLDQGICGSSSIKLLLLDTCPRGETTPPPTTSTPIIIILQTSNQNSPILKRSKLSQLRLLQVRAAQDGVL